jgi:fluoride ion exporter CrcB/FEX
MRLGLLRTSAVLVALGGAVGAGVRWAVLEVLPGGEQDARTATTTLVAVDDNLYIGLQEGLPWGLPWPVVLVNFIGCGLLGVLMRRAGARVRVGGTAGAGKRPGAADLAGAGDQADRALLLIGTGFCGGLTTFSTFAVDAAELMRDARPGAAASYVVLSVALGFGAFLLGRGAGRGNRANR